MTTIAANFLTTRFSKSIWRPVLVANKTPAVETSLEVLQILHRLFRINSIPVGEFFQTSYGYLEKILANSARKICKKSISRALNHLKGNNLIETKLEDVILKNGSRYNNALHIRLNFGELSTSSSSSNPQKERVSNSSFFVPPSGQNVPYIYNSLSSKKNYKNKNIDLLIDNNAHAREKSESTFLNNFLSNLSEGNFTMRASEPKEAKKGFLDFYNQFTQEFYEKILEKLQQELPKKLNGEITIPYNATPAFDAASIKEGLFTCGTRYPTSFFIEENLITYIVKALLQPYRSLFEKKKEKVEKWEEVPSTLGVTTPISETKIRNLRAFYPLSAEDCGKLQTLSGRDFKLHPMNEILLDMAERYPDKLFPNKESFMHYMGKAFKYEMRDAVKTDNETFCIKNNLSSKDPSLQDKIAKQQEIAKHEEYLAEIESTRQVSPEWHFKKKLASILEREKAYNVLTSLRNIISHQEGTFTLELSKDVELSSMDKKLILEAAKATHEKGPRLIKNVNGEGPQRLEFGEDRILIEEIEELEIIISKSDFEDRGAKRNFPPFTKALTERLKGQLSSTTLARLIKNEMYVDESGKDPILCFPEMNIEEITNEEEEDIIMKEIKAITEERKSLYRQSKEIKTTTITLANVEGIWGIILKGLGDYYNDQWNGIYTAWFSKITPEVDEECKFVKLKVPMPFMESRITEQYGFKLDSLFEEIGYQYEVRG